MLYDYKVVKSPTTGVITFKYKLNADTNWTDLATTTNDRDAMQLIQLFRQHGPNNFPTEIVLRQGTVNIHD